MPGVIPNYKTGPTSWPVCGFGGVGTPTTITGGQLCHPNAAQQGMIEPCPALAVNFLGVAANDGAAPRTSQDGANPAVLSQQPDILALYYGVDIDVTYATNSGCGNLLVAGAAGTVAQYGLSTTSAPGVPTSGTPVTNNTGQDVTVVISAGTMTAVIINGVVVGAGAGTYNLPEGQAIQLTYTVAPTWTWTGVAGAETVDCIIGRCSQPGGVIIASGAVAAARIATVL